MPSPGHHHVGRAVLVAESVAADDDRLGPAGHQARHVRDHDRLAEDDATEDVPDRPVRRAVHLLEAELLDPGLVGGDRRALDPDAVLLDRVRRIDRDLVVGRVAAFDAEVVVLEVDVEVRKDQLILDERPDDPGHLVAVEFDYRIVDFDLRQGLILPFVFHWFSCCLAVAADAIADGRRRNVPPVRSSASMTATHEVFNQSTAARGREPFRDRPAAARKRFSAKAVAGPPTGSRNWARSAARPRSCAGASMPTSSRRSSRPTTASATGSTRSSSTRPGTS